MASDPRGAGDTDAFRLQGTVRLSADGVAKVLGDLEALVMRVVWEIGHPAPAREVHGRVMLKGIPERIKEIRRTVLHRMDIGENGEKANELVDYLGKLAEAVRRLDGAGLAIDDLVDAEAIVPVLDRCYTLVRIRDALEAARLQGIHSGWKRSRSRTLGPRP